mmetsp:Transcript_21869/g.65557  ORF Transcript_21869/g.65557 Transcript_21869/m.65557 type:complete len:180 (+) Transcript_21869:208-747(+)
MLRALTLSLAALTPSAAFQPARAVARRVAAKTATPASRPATMREPLLAVPAGGAGPGGRRLATLLQRAGKVSVISGLFCLAGLAEIGGGWLVWKACREGAPRAWAAYGAVVLALYGFIPCLQPIDDFGRLYAAYGGVFIGMSFAWGRFVDGMAVDRGDLIGSAVALLGVCIVLFWPRGS